MRDRLVMIALVLAGCGSAPTENVADSQRSCQLTVGFRPGMAPELAKRGHIAADPVLTGSWVPPAQAWETARASDGTEWRLLTVSPPSGLWQYAFDVGGTRVLDEANPRSAFGSDGSEVSELDVPDCTRPALEVLETHGGTDGLRVLARFVRGQGGATLDPASLRAELWHGAEPLPSSSSSSPSPSIERTGAAGVWVRADGLAPGKYTVRLSAADAAGHVADVAVASAFVEAQPDRGLTDGLVYQIMIDRFRGAGPLTTPASPGDRAGGTIDGVRAALEAGYFDRLGVSTLWLSPVYQNPTGHFTGRDGHLYEAYHGYWPDAPRAVEPLLGGEAALDALVAAAHGRGLRVVVDAVPNHVHALHPYYKDHSRQNPAAPLDWFNDASSDCICGVGACDWGGHMETCWFDRYLPDLNWRLPEVMQAGTDDLAWWVQRFDLDGLRIDAVPMMPRAATRRMVARVRGTGAAAGLDRLLLGEIFTGPGDDGRAQIRAFLGQTLDGLDSAFDFPLMWALRQTIAHGQGSLEDLEAARDASDAAFAGAGATIAHMLDNHDTTRFLSESADAAQANGDPWTNAPPQPTDEAPYRRQLLALTYLLTTPGLPVIYYGDEVGLAGANDPDSRRVLPDVLAPSTLPAPQATLLAQVAKLGRLRRCLPALRSSRRVVALLDADHLVTLHEGGAIVALSRAGTPSILHATGARDGRYVDILGGGAITVANGAANLPLPPLAAAVYLPEASACLE